MKVNYDYEWQQYLTNYVVEDTGVLNEKDIYHMDTKANSKTSQIRVFTTYKDPSDRRRKESKSVLIEMTYNEFVRDRKITEVLA